jgi:glutathione S-transferase
MKLFYSAGSPFVRKVMACAIARELVERIELIPTVANQSPPALLAANPLSKVPCLVTGDGVAMFDSPVICEYLDSLDGTLPMFPSHGGVRVRALILQALGDGMMDAAVLRRGESLRPAEAARTANMNRQKAAIDRSLAVLEAELPHQTVDIGSISIGCALGYLDFRFAHEPWRPAHPHLAGWFAEFAKNPCMAQTEPRDAA